MFRKLLESFTATHVTAIVITAILAPSAVYAVATQAVSITDPSTGAKSYVDPARRLYVYDPIAGLKNNPANAIEINFSNTGDHCEGQSYKVPAGKALIITAISGWASGNGDFSGFALMSAANCGGRTLSDWFTEATYAPVAVEFGSGIPVAAGQTLSIFSGKNNGFTRVHGYLIPAGALPAVGEADEPLQGTVSTLDTVKAKLAVRLKPH